MKYFSLTYQLEKEDYEAYYKDFSSNNKILLLKRSLPLMIFLGFFVFLYARESKILILPVFYLFAVSVILSYYYTKKFSLSIVNSKKNRKKATYDFYADHIEIHMPPDENCRSYGERHLKMNGFSSVYESSINFYFLYKREKMLIIPKKVLDEETYSMIKNLIDNYFSNVYMKI